MNDRISIASSEESDMELMLPRSPLFAASTQGREDKQGMGGPFPSAGLQGLLGTPGMNMGGPNIMRNPARRFYDPEVTTTSIYLPREQKTKNRWCRWFYAHDELVGTVLDLHAELPYSRAELALDDHAIKRQYEDCLDETQFFSRLPEIDLEYLKIGEVFINTSWDSKKGYWNHIIPLNPDFVDVRFSPFADQEAVIELIPDDELKKIVHSNKPEEQTLKKRIPQEILKRVLSGRNIVLNPEEVTHIARKLSPYDVRGTGIIQRLFRTLMYEDKLRESQLSIADNFIYPLKIFKLGDPNKGWIPSAQHQTALAGMLQQAAFDPNFSLIYHYGLSVDVITVADKVMKLEKEWSEINNRKMIALGVSQQFLGGDATFSSASVGLQIQLARYKAKRDLFEIRWIRDKFFKVMAERNEWYKRDKKEIAGQYRISRSDTEKKERLIMPELVWHKKLMLRDDQAFLTFLNNVYAQGKGPISAATLLEGMGLSLEDELRKKKSQKELEQKVGEFVTPPAPGAPGAGGGILGLGAPGGPSGAPPMGGGAPGGVPMAPPPVGGPKAFFKTLFKQSKPLILDINKTATVEELVPEIITDHLDDKHVNETPDLQKSILSGSVSDIKYAETTDKILTAEQADMMRRLEDTEIVTDKAWLRHASSPTVPLEVAAGLHKVHNKLLSFNKKYADDLTALSSEKDYIVKTWQDIYVQGKLTAYGTTNFLSIHNAYYAEEGQLKDYSDIIICNEFADWYDLISRASMSFTKKASKIRNISNVCFALGQLKGFQEQGINNIRLSNTDNHDGLHYKIPDLQKHGINLDSFISANGEVVLFTPCIEGYDDEAFGNALDPQIRRYQDFMCDDIMVKNCPIEFTQTTQRVFAKLYNYLKPKYSKIVFVQDVIQLPEWEHAQIAHYKKELGAIQEASAIASERVSLDKLQKVGTVATLGKGATLFISNWIGMEEVPFTSNLINHLAILNDEAILKKISKVYKTPVFDLSQDELDTYKVFNYIDPVLDDNQSCRGYKVSFKNVDSLPAKLRFGSTWSVDGKCLTTMKQSGYDIFTSNLRNWIDYPHKIDQSLHYLFTGVL